MPDTDLAYLLTSYYQHVYESPFQLAACFEKPSRLIIYCCAIRSRESYIKNKNNAAS